MAPTKRNQIPSGPARPWTTCKECGEPEALITHTKNGDKWCIRCGKFDKGTK